MTHLKCSKGHIIIEGDKSIEGICPHCYREGQMTEDDIKFNEKVNEYLEIERRNEKIKNDMAQLLPFSIENCFVDGYTITIPDIAAGNDDYLFLNAETYLGDLSQYTHQEIIDQFMGCIINTLDAIDLLDDAQIDAYKESGGLL